MYSYHNNNGNKRRPKHVDVTYYAHGRRDLTVSLLQTLNRLNRYLIKTPKASLIWTEIDGLILKHMELLKKIQNS